MHPLPPSALLRRVAGVARERSLAGSMMPAPPAPVFPYVSPERPEAQAPHFVAEMFFLTQRLIHVGLMPTGKHGGMPAVHAVRAVLYGLGRQGCSALGACLWEGMWEEQACLSSSFAC